MRNLLLILLLLVGTISAQAQNIQNNPGSNHGNKFEQLGTIFPTPNEYRTASGAPGPKYWQQRCDYDIVCELDEKNVLTYLWLQLDENEHSSVNNANYQNSSSLSRQLSVQQLQQAAEEKGDNGLGFQITKLTDALGKPLRYTINKTMMRVELPTPLKPGQRFAFKLDWNYKITDRMTIGGRGGYEFFPEDGNHLFTMSQWYPRLCVYSDFKGWQNQQFTGRGEFALTFGNFKVQMTVPADHVVLSTGECQNYPLVLSPAQLSRWNKAQTTKEPIEVVTLEEAKAAEKQKSSQKKTWIYKADNVRDFAWTSSRKFIWDAMPAMVEGKKVMCMSGYPKEAYGLYRPYSTKAVAHTIKSYSKFTIPYPYPVAQSIEASNGMEYPMICFNYGRTEKDGTYSESTKNGMLGVIIHEVGHNFFPMIINSDERQWSWMDEGDYAFKEYCRRWAFKHPEPADLFRTLEDASGEDLDWFWRGWFYSTDVCDISLDTVKYAMVDTAATQASGRASSFKRSADRPLVNSFEDISKIRNREDKSITFATDADTTLRDFYWRYARGLEPYDTAQIEMSFGGAAPEKLTAEEKAKFSNLHQYELTFSNKGGLIMPIIIEWTYKDGSKEVEKIPAQVWRLNEKKVTKAFIKDKEVASVKLDPLRETADIDEKNNSWNKFEAPSRFTIFKQGQGPRRGAGGQSGNPMQRAQEAKKGF